VKRCFSKGIGFSLFFTANVGLQNSFVAGLGVFQEFTLSYADDGSAFSNKWVNSKHTYV
jgi:hypothetical protein